MFLFSNVVTAAHMSVHVDVCVCMCVSASTSELRCTNVNLENTFSFLFASARLKGRHLFFTLVLLFNISNLCVITISEWTFVFSKLVSFFFQTVFFLTGIFC